MMDFNTAINRVLGIEGGYVNNPNDPGGETKFGISKRSYPNVDIKNLTREGAVSIYHIDFWTPLQGGGLYGSVMYQALDFAVNSGIQTSIRYLQRALAVADDGHWGPVTKAAASAMSETDQIMRYVAERIDFCRKSSKWPSFGNGWAGRWAQDLRYGAEDS